MVTGCGMVFGDLIFERFPWNVRAIKNVNIKYISIWLKEKTHGWGALEFEAV